jgi:hypothetical protein
MTITGLSLKGRKLPLLIAAVLFAGANVAFFLAYRSGAQTRRAALEARRDDLRRGVEAGEVEAARVLAQKERLGGVSAAMEEFYDRRIGTERESLAPIVDEIHAILKETGVAAPQIAYTTIALPKLPLAQMRITFTVRCDYARFKQLLRAFETSKKWIVVKDVAIGRDSEKPGTVQVQLGLVTYFSEGADAPEKPDERARGALAARKAG